MTSNITQLTKLLELIKSQHLQDRAALESLVLEASQADPTLYETAKVTRDIYDSKYSQFMNSIVNYLHHLPYYQSRLDELKSQLPSPPLTNP